MTEVRPKPCSSCPYRVDVPSGVWDASEYEKLPPYDRPTVEQPFGLFMCHNAPGQVCSGWATCHSRMPHDRFPIALRLSGVTEIPDHGVELFNSGQEAHDHGMRDVDSPSRAAIEAGRRVREVRRRR